MQLLADAVLVFHAAFVAFVGGGLLAISIGAWRGWAWVRRFGFRVTHLGAIGFVALEAVIGLACPLTVLEDRLRGMQTAAGFIERVLRRILYWDLPTGVFTVAYLVVAGAAALTYVAFPPRSRRNP